MNTKTQERVGQIGGGGNGRHAVSIRHGEASELAGGLQWVHVICFVICGLQKPGEWPVS